MHDVTQRVVQANGIRLHIAEAGEGPLVLLLHGFPESWAAWRHQLLALADAGFHAVAPDLRGYGRSERPEALEAYDIFQLTGDAVGLANALGASSATIAGHDWGAVVAMYSALFRPDLFRRLILLSVPYAPRREMSQSAWEQQKYPGKIFYQAILRSPMAESYFNADPRERLLGGLYALSGEVAPEHRWQFVRDPNAPIARTFEPRMPSWLDEEYLDFVEGEFKRTGFTGGLNYYRNMDRNWALTPFLDGAKILQPSLFIAGEKDPVIEFLSESYATLETNMPNLRRKVLIPGTGHWVQQEMPAEVNQLMIEFLQETR